MTNILLIELKYSDTINYDETSLFNFCAELKSKKRLYSQVRTVKSPLPHNLGNNVFRASRESNSGHFRWHAGAFPPGYSHYKYKQTLQSMPRGLTEKLMTFFQSLWLSLEPTDLYVLLRKELRFWFERKQSSTKQTVLNTPHVANASWKFETTPM